MAKDSIKANIDNFISLKEFIEETCLLNKYQKIAFTKYTTKSYMTVEEWNSEVEKFISGVL